jgi:predicted DNA-binding protein with PD1-like motif
MKAHPLRLFPGDDLRTVLEDTLRELALRAAFVIQGVGSLSVAQLRFAGAPHPTELRGDLEILTLAGSISPDGAHLHMSVSDTCGLVLGGHVARGCTVRTTAEILLALLPKHYFSREHDERSGFAELVIRADSASGSIGASHAGAKSTSLDIATDCCDPSNVRR